MAELDNRDDLVALCQRQAARVIEMKRELDDARGSLRTAREVEAEVERLRSERNAYFNQCLDRGTVKVQLREANARLRTAREALEWVADQDVDRDGDNVYAGPYAKCARAALRELDKEDGDGQRSGDAVGSVPLDADGDSSGTADVRIASADQGGLTDEAIDDHVQGILDEIGGRSFYAIKERLRAVIAADRARKAEQSNADWLLKTRRASPQSREGEGAEPKCPRCRGRRWVLNAQTGYDDPCDKCGWIGWNRPCQTR